MSSSEDINLINDDNQLRKMWQEEDDITEKRRIRSRMYQLREERMRDVKDLDQCTSEETSLNFISGETNIEVPNSIRESSTEASSETQVFQSESVHIYRHGNGEYSAEKNSDIQTEDDTDDMKEGKITDLSKHSHDRFHMTTEATAMSRPEKSDRSGDGNIRTNQKTQNMLDATFEVNNGKIIVEFQPDGIAKTRRQVVFEYDGDEPSVDEIQAKLLELGLAAPRGIDSKLTSGKPHDCELTHSETYSAHEQSRTVIREFAKTEESSTEKISEEVTNNAEIEVSNGQISVTLDPENTIQCTQMVWTFCGTEKPSCESIRDKLVGFSYDDIPRIESFLREFQGVIIDEKNERIEDESRIINRICKTLLCGELDKPSDYSVIPKRRPKQQEIHIHGNSVYIWNPKTELMDANQFFLEYTGVPDVEQIICILENSGVNGLLEIVQDMQLEITRDEEPAIDGKPVDTFRVALGDNLCSAPGALCHKFRVRVVSDFISISYFNHGEETDPKYSLSIEGSNKFLDINLFLEQISQFQQQDDFLSVEVFFSQSISGSISDEIFHRNTDDGGEIFCRKVVLGAMDSPLTTEESSTDFSVQFIDNKVFVYFKKDSNPGKIYRITLEGNAVDSLSLKCELENLKLFRSEQIDWIEAEIEKNFEQCRKTDEPSERKFLKISSFTKTSETNLDLFENFQGLARDNESQYAKNGLPQKSNVEDIESNKNRAEYISEKREENWLSHSKCDKEPSLLTPNTADGKSGSYLALPEGVDIVLDDQGMCLKVTPIIGDKIQNSIDIKCEGASPDVAQLELILQKVRNKDWTGLNQVLIDHGALLLEESDEDVETIDGKTFCRRRRKYQSSKQQKVEKSESIETFTRSDISPSQRRCGVNLTPNRMVGSKDNERLNTELRHHSDNRSEADKSNDAQETYHTGHTTKSGTNEKETRQNSPRKQEKASPALNDTNESTNATERNKLMKNKNPNIDSQKRLLNRVESVSSKARTKTSNQNQTDSISNSRFRSTRTCSINQKPLLKKTNEISKNKQHTLDKIGYEKVSGTPSNIRKNARGKTSSDVILKSPSQGSNNTASNNRKKFVEAGMENASKQVTGFKRSVFTVDHLTGQRVTRKKSDTEKTSERLADHSSRSFANNRTSRSPMKDRKTDQSSRRDSSTVDNQLNRSNSKPRRKAPLDTGLTELRRNSLKGKELADQSGTGVSKENSKRLEEHRSSSGVKIEAKENGNFQTAIDKWNGDSENKYTCSESITRKLDNNHKTFGLNEYELTQKINTISLDHQSASVVKSISEIHKVPDASEKSVSAKKSLFESKIEDSNMVRTVASLSPRVARKPTIWDKPDELDDKLVTPSKILPISSPVLESNSFFDSSKNHEQSLSDDFHKLLKNGKTKESPSKTIEKITTHVPGNNAGTQALTAKFDEEYSLKSNIKVENSENLKLMKNSNEINKTTKRKYPSCPIQKTPDKKKIENTTKTPKKDVQSHSPTIKTNSHSKKVTTDSSVNIKKSSGTSFKRIGAESSLKAATDTGRGKVSEKTVQGKSPSEGREQRRNSQPRSSLNGTESKENVRNKKIESGRQNLKTPNSNIKSPARNRRDDFINRVSKKAQNGSILPKDTETIPNFEKRNSGSSGLRLKVLKNDSVQTKQKTISNTRLDKTTSGSPKKEPLHLSTLKTCGNQKGLVDKQRDSQEKVVPKSSQQLLNVEFPDRSKSIKCDSDLISNSGKESKHLHSPFLVGNVNKNAKNSSKSDDKSGGEILKSDATVFISNEPYCESEIRKNCQKKGANKSILENLTFLRTLDDKPDIKSDGVKMRSDFNRNSCSPDTDNQSSSDEDQSALTYESGSQKSSLLRTGKLAKTVELFENTTIQSPASVIECRRVTANDSVSRARALFEKKNSVSPVPYEKPDKHRSDMPSQKRPSIESDGIKHLLNRFGSSEKPKKDAQTKPAGSSMLTTSPTLQSTAYIQLSVNANISDKMKSQPNDMKHENKLIENVHDNRAEMNSQRQNAHFEVENNEPGVIDNSENSSFNKRIAVESNDNQENSEQSRTENSESTNEQQESESMRKKSYDDHPKCYGSRRQSTIGELAQEPTKNDQHCSGQLIDQNKHKPVSLEYDSNEQKYDISAPTEENNDIAVMKMCEDIESDEQEEKRECSDKLTKTKSKTVTNFDSEDRENQQSNIENPLNETMTTSTVEEQDTENHQFSVRAFESCSVAKEPDDDSQKLQENNPTDYDGKEVQLSSQSQTASTDQLQSVEAPGTKTAQPPPTAEQRQETDSEQAIEEINDVKLLDEMLFKTKEYEKRSRIRARMRHLKRQQLLESMEQIGAKVRKKTPPKYGSHAAAITESTRKLTPPKTPAYENRMNNPEAENLTKKSDKSIPLSTYSTKVDIDTNRKSSDIINPTTTDIEDEFSENTTVEDMIGDSNQTDGSDSWTDLRKPIVESANRWQRNEDKKDNTNYPVPRDFHSPDPLDMLKTDETAPEYNLVDNSDTHGSKSIEEKRANSCDNIENREHQDGEKCESESEGILMNLCDAQETCSTRHPPRDAPPSFSIPESYSETRMSFNENDILQTVTTRECSPIHQNISSSQAMDNDNMKAESVFQTSHAQDVHEVISSSISNETADHFDQFIESTSTEMCLTEVTMENSATVSEGAALGLEESRTSASNDLSDVVTDNLYSQRCDSKEDSEYIEQPCFRDHVDSELAENSNVDHVENSVDSEEVVVENSESNETESSRNSAAFKSCPPIVYSTTNILEENETHCVGQVDSSVSNECSRAAKSTQNREEVSHVDTKQEISPRPVEKAAEAQTPSAENNKAGMSRLTERDVRRSSSVSREKVSTDSIDAVISCYGPGPTDENGRPLVGLKALRRQKLKEEPPPSSGTLVEMDCEKTVTEHQTTESVSDHRDLHDMSDVRVAANMQQESACTEAPDNSVSACTEYIEGSTEHNEEAKKYPDEDAASGRSLSSLPDRKPAGILKKPSPQLTPASTMTSLLQDVTDDVLHAVSDLEEDDANTTLALDNSSLIRTKSPLLQRRVSRTVRRTVSEASGSVDSKSNSDSDVEATEDAASVSADVGGNSSGQFTSYLDDASPVADITDVLARMKAPCSEGSTAGAESRQLLNKFIGAQMVMSEMASTQRQTETQSHTIDGSSVSSVRECPSGAPTAESADANTDLHRTQACSEEDIICGVDINKLNDRSELKKLLERCDDFDKRRKIRARIMTVLESAATAIDRKSSESKQTKTEYQQRRDGGCVTVEEANFIANWIEETTTTTSPGRASVAGNRFSSSSSLKSSTMTSSSSSSRLSPADKSAAAVSPFDKFRRMDSENKSNIATRTSSSELGFKLDGGLASKAQTNKDMMLYWCQCRLRSYKDVNVENFSTSWNDGMAFCALIHHFYPDAFDFDELDPKNRRHNFQLAFATADNLAGVYPLLDVDDMVRMKKPDWKCVFTYVQTLYNRLKDGP